MYMHMDMSMNMHMYMSMHMHMFMYRSWLHFGTCNFEMQPQQVVLETASESSTSCETA